MGPAEFPFDINIPMKISRASVSDLDRVMGIIREAALWIRDKGIDQWAHRLEPDAVDVVRQAIEEREVYLVTAGAEDVATFTLQWDDEAWWGEKGKDGQAIYLHGFAVGTAWHGRNVGASVLRWIEEYGQEHGRSIFRLDCNAKNPRLNRYYAEMGFRAQGRREVRHGRLIFLSNVYEKPL